MSQYGIKGCAKIPKYWKMVSSNLLNR